MIPVNRAGASLIVAMCDPSNIYAIDDLKFLTGYNIEPVVASEPRSSEAIERYYDEEGAVARRDRGRLRRRGHRGRQRRGRRQRRRRSAQGSRRRAGRQAGEPDPDRRDQEGRLRHPRRALREGLPRPLPHRRRALRGDAAADEAARTRSPRASRSWPSSTSPSAACRRTAASSSSSARARRWTSASRVCPTLFGEKIVHASARQVEPPARHDQARLRAAAARRLQGGHRPALTAWCWSPAPPARARPRRSTRRSPSSTRSATNICTAEDPVEFNLAGINQVQMHEDIGLNFAAALRSLPAPGPRHHHGRRDPRLRDGGDRGQGGAHRPPGALDAAHQRRARARSPACSTWASSRSW